MSRPCKAVIAAGDGSYTVDTITVESPLADEVLVQVKAAGLCHTDHDSINWGKPLVMGHEGAGIVVEIGPDVTGVAVGDSVILNWATPCKTCFQCKLGNEHICEQNSPVVAGGNGFTPGHARLEGTHRNGEPILRSFNIGTLSEYTLVKESACVKMEGGKLGFPSASIISCGVMTGFGSVVKTGQVTPGTSVVVLGCGGVGLNAIQGARIAGAAKIIAIDLNEGRLEMARQFGATDTVLANRSDQGLLGAAEQVKTMTEGRGADYAFECTAVPALGAAPLAMVRNAGTAVQVSGIEEEITIDMRLFEWDKKYINPLYGQCQPQEDFRTLVELFNSGELLLDEMITNTYSIEEIETAFADMLSGKNAKGVIVFD